MQKDRVRRIGLENSLEIRVRFRAGKYGKVSKSERYVGDVENGGIAATSPAPREVQSHEGKVVINSSPELLPEAALSPV